MNFKLELIIRAVIAITVVLFAFKYLSKFLFKSLQDFFKKKSESDSIKRIDGIISRKIIEMGGLPAKKIEANIDPLAKTSQETKSNGPSLEKNNKFQEEYLKKFNKQELSPEDKQTLYFFEEIAKKQGPLINQIKSNAENKIKIDISNYDVIKTFYDANAENIIIPLKKKQPPLKFKEISVTITSAILVSFLIQEAIKGTGPIIAKISKNKPANYSLIAKAIEVVLLEKMPSNQDKLIEDAIKSPLAYSRKLKQLSDLTIRRICFRLICDPQQNKILSPEDIFLQIETIFNKIEITKENQTKFKEEEKVKRREYPKFNSELENAFKILDCDKSDSTKIIKRKFNRLALEKHPDKIGISNASPSKLKEAHEEFVKIQDAYHKIKKYRQSIKKSA